VTDILSHSEFDPLDDVERNHLREVLRDPEQRWIYIAGVVAVQRKEARARELACVAPGGCRETIQRRLSRLERFKWWLIGVGGGIGALLALLEALK
jgi:hypothetical protein